MNITELRKSPHLSASGISDYTQCGLSYKFSRIDKIPFELRPDSMEFGTCIHKVLGKIYEEKRNENYLTIEDIHIIFEEEWREIAEDKDNIEYTKGNDFESLLIKGKDILSIYNINMPKDNFKVIAIEEPFSFKLPDVPIPIIGAIDLIEQDESGALIITDWKTASKAYSNSDIDNNFQLSLYNLAMRYNGYSDHEILLRFDCLIKTKIPKFAQYWTVRNDEKRVINKIKQVWNGIEKKVFVANDTGWKCGYCSYKSNCDQFLET